MSERERDARDSQRGRDSDGECPYRRARRPRSLSVSDRANFNGRSGERRAECGPGAECNVPFDSPGDCHEERCGGESRRRQNFSRQRSFATLRHQRTEHYGERARKHTCPGRRRRRGERSYCKRNCNDSGGDQPPSCARAELSTRSRTAMSYEHKRGFVSHERGACRSGKTHAGRGGAARRTALKRAVKRAAHRRRALGGACWFGGPSLGGLRLAPIPVACWTSPRPSPVCYRREHS